MSVALHQRQELSARKVLSLASQGLSALPQRYYLDTGLQGSARTAAFRDADSAAICKSESHMEVGSCAMHPRIDLARAESREGLKEDGKWEAKV
jgi:hypothetical protein